MEGDHEDRATRRSNDPGPPARHAGGLWPALTARSCGVWWHPRPIAGIRGSEVRQQVMRSIGCGPGRVRDERLLRLTVQLVMMKPQCQSNRMRLEPTRRSGWLAGAEPHTQPHCRFDEAVLQGAGPSRLAQLPSGASPPQDGLLDCFSSLPLAKSCCLQYDAPVSRTRIPGRLTPSARSG